MAVAFDTLKAATRLQVLRGQMEVLRGQMRELEQRMTVRLGAMIAAAVGIIVAPDKLL